MQQCNSGVGGQAPECEPGVEANARLTGSAAVVLVPLLAVEWVTGLAVGSLLHAHVLVGFLLVPPVLLKLGSVGYRFVGYYAGSPGTERPVRRGLGCGCWGR